MKLTLQGEQEITEFYKLYGLNKIEIDNLIAVNKQLYSDLSITISLTMPQFIQLIIPVIRNYVNRYQSWSKLISEINGKVYDGETHLNI